LESFREEILETQELQKYLNEIWGNLKEIILKDISNPESKFHKHLELFLNDLGEFLENNENVQRELNKLFVSIIKSVFNKHGNEISRLIEDIVKKWDIETITKKLEFEIGKDLQYIRLNGTVVGGFVGLLICLFSLLIQ